MPRLRPTATEIIRVRDGQKELSTIPRELEAILSFSSADRPTAKAKTIPMMLVDRGADAPQIICERRHSLEVVDSRIGIRPSFVVRLQVCGFLWLTFKMSHDRGWREPCCSEHGS
jgi:hypothetical protein